MRVENVSTLRSQLSAVEFEWIKMIVAISTNEIQHNHHQIQRNTMEDTQLLRTTLERNEEIDVYIE